MLLQSSKTSKPLQISNHLEFALEYFLEFVLIIQYPRNGRIMFTTTPYSPMHVG